MTIDYHRDRFPPQLEIGQPLRDLIAEARTELGRYDGFLLSLPNPGILLSPLFTQEAVVSSKIEGTQSSLSEVLAYEAQQQGLSQSQQDDAIEVLNYRRALFEAKENLEKLPWCQRVFKQAHRTLMQEVRGRNKNPGEYRKIPVWIGGDSLETARFVPAEVQHIQRLMQNLDAYLHEDQTDSVLKTAILHVEFEAIHPFLDGNGRLGRMMIPLFLWQEGLLHHPSFYMSSYVDRHRDRYYRLLFEVSANDDWESWCLFFVQGIAEQARDNLKKAGKIVASYDELKKKIPGISRSPYGITALDFIFKQPYFNSSQFYQTSGVPRTIAKSLLDRFVEHQLLTCLKGRGRKPNVYLFDNLIKIADGE